VDPLFAVHKKERDGSCERREKSEVAKMTHHRHCRLACRPHLDAIAVLWFCCSWHTEWDEFSILGGEKRRVVDGEMEGLRLGWRCRELGVKASSEGVSWGLSCILDIELMLFWWKLMTGDSRTIGDIL